MCGQWWVAPRRGEVARQGAHLLVPQCAAPLGSEEPASGVVEPVQHPPARGRKRARVSAVELDGARHLALHPSRADPGAIAVPGRGAARSEEHTSELQSLMRISYAVFCLQQKNQTKDTQ